MNQPVLGIVLFAFAAGAGFAAVRLAGIVSAWLRHGRRIPRQHAVLWLAGILAALRIAKILLEEVKRSGIF